MGLGLPALLGGEPLNASLPDWQTWPQYDGQEAEALERVLRSGRWGSLGMECVRLSQSLAKLCGVRYALLTNSGSHALELVLRALEIGRGDDVVMTGYCFTACAQACVMVGAVPVFADIDLGTLCMSPDGLEARITPRTKAIVATHLAGRPCDMDALTRIAAKRKLPLIEDASQAHGSRWRGAHVGGIGTAGVFSCHATQNCTCGEGGAIVTNDNQLFKAVWSLHNNGRAFGDGGQDSFFLGGNARMTEFQAAVLRPQVERLATLNEKRMRNARALTDALRSLPFVEPLQDDSRVTAHAYHFYPFRYHAEALGSMPRSLFVRALNAENVCEASQGYNAPVYGMRFLYDESFRRATGRTMRNPIYTLPNCEIAANREGCWLQQTALLGGEDDALRIAEAMRRIAAHSRELMAKAG